MTDNIQSRRIMHAGDVVGSQAWTDGRTKTNVAKKYPHFILFSCRRLWWFLPNQYSWQNNLGCWLVFLPIMQKLCAENKTKSYCFSLFFCEENRTVSASAKHELHMASTEKYLLLVSWSLTCDTVINRGRQKNKTQKNQDRDWSS